MNKLFKYAMMIMAMVMSFAAISCGGDDGGDDGNDTTNALNKAFAGTKWTVSNKDYSFGDDWAGEQSSTITIYFYSNTEGAYYIGTKDYYTDTGSSSSREIYFFNYDVTKEGIYLDYFTYPSNCYYLEINNGSLYIDQTELTKKSITSEDTKWLNQHKGTTGQCRWYHDFNNLFIIGEGDMADYTSGNCPWNGLGISSIIVQDGVTSIGNNAFKGLKAVKLDLPNSITKIGIDACAGLLISSFDIPVNVVEIGDGAFSDCEYLKSLKLNSSKLEKIGDYAFSDCPIKMSSFSLPPEVKSVGSGAFMGAKLGKLTLNDKLETIGTGAFSGVSGTITIPNSVKSIGSVAFDGTYSKIVIGTGLTTLSEGAFYSDAKSGSMYVNLGVPLDVNNNIISNGGVTGYAESNWNLYVPKGSKSAYSKKSPWSKFKSITEDSSLTSGNGEPDDDDNGDDNQGTKVYDKETYSYIIDGVEYKMILVEGNSTIPTFRIMQTELPPNSYLQVGDKFMGILNSHMDEAVITSEFREFIDELRDATGTPFRLPTRAEWQFAARGGKTVTSNKYSGSNNIDDVAWYKDNSSNHAHDIATKEPNELGIYDMCGNYAEVCNDGIGSNANEIDYNIDGYDCGGSYLNDASECTIASYVQDPISGKIAGSRYKNKNAIIADHVTIRLVYTVPKQSK